MDDAGYFRSTDPMRKVSVGHGATVSLCIESSGHQAVHANVVIFDLLGKHLAQVSDGSFGNGISGDARTGTRPDSPARNSNDATEVLLDHDRNDRTQNREQSLQIKAQHAVPYGLGSLVDFPGRESPSDR